MRFRDNNAIKRAIASAIERALFIQPTAVEPSTAVKMPEPQAVKMSVPPVVERPVPPVIEKPTRPVTPTLPTPAPVAVELPLAAADSEKPKPWAWFHYLATTASGYLMIETDAGIVTINPHAARERIAFERLQATDVSQALLIPETVQLPPHDFARLKAALPTIESMGFRLEPFGRDTFKVEAVPQVIDGLTASAVLATIARDLAEGSGHRSGGRWREDIIARSVAKSFAGMSLSLTEEGAVKLVEELASCRMPYVCPRGKPVMIFTSTRELNRKFSRD